MNTALRQHRIQMGYAQKDVAAAVGTDVANLWRVETGKQTPKPQLARKLFEFFGGAISLAQIYDPVYCEKKGIK